MGVKRPRKKCWQGFFGLEYKEIKDCCASCPKCQLVASQLAHKSTLVSILLGIPFGEVGVDLVGPLECNSRRSRFILVLSEYATWLPQGSGDLLGISTNGGHRATMVFLPDVHSQGGFNGHKYSIHVPVITGCLGLTEGSFGKNISVPYPNRWPN